MQRWTALFCVPGWLCLSAAGADFYIATNGNDAWSGTLASPNVGRTDGPFATLEAARDALRRPKGVARLGAGTTVWLRGGTYSRERTFELIARDSGTPSAPVIYRAYTNETPSLLGGRRVNGFTPIKDSAVKARLCPKHATMCSR
jgi:hypothetical protein